MTTFFEHQRTSFKRNYLKNLIALAAADGHLDPEERDMIVTIGLKRGLKLWQIEGLLADPGAHTLFLPESIANRMNLLYDIMLIIYADHEVNAKELEFITSVVKAFQLPDSTVDELLKLFELEAPSTTTWREFTEDLVSHAQADRHAVTA